MRKLTILNLAGVTILAAGILGSNISYAKTSQLTAVPVDAERIYYSDSQSYHKPGSPIRYAYSMPKNIAVGDIVTIDLTLLTPFQSGDLRVDCTVKGDVNLIANSGQTNFNMSRGNEHEMPVTFTVNSLGRHYIQVQAVSDASDRGPSFRAFSIPVQVGPKQAPAPHPGLQRTASGDMVISLKAIEDIK